MKGNIGATDPKISLKAVVIFFMTAAFLALYSCSKKSESDMPTDTLVAVDGRYLTRGDVQKALPGGLSAADSTSFAKTFIRSWIDNRLLVDVASGQVDMDEINKLVEDYRVELIMTRYRTEMARQAPGGIMSDDSLKAFYEHHPEDFKLERPLLKGVYLKIPDDSPQLSLLRRLYVSERSADMDRLEKAALNSALHYDYFLDRWVDLEQIETRIPKDLDGYDATFRNKGHIDIHHDGFVYLLSVHEYLPVGSVMPYEAAEPLVRERLLNRVRADYDRQLRQELFDKAMSDGTLEFPVQNPLK